MQVILKGSLRHFPPAALLRFLGGCGQGGTLDMLSEDGGKVRLFVRDGGVLAAGDPIAAVAEAIGFESGAFALVDEVVLPDGVAAEPVAIDDIVTAAEKQLARRRTFADSTLFHVVENPDGQPQISMTADEFKLILKMGGGRTFAELAEGRPRQEVSNVLRSMEERGLITFEEAAAPTPQEEPPATQIIEVPAKRRAAALTNDAGDAWPLLDDLYTVGRDPDTNDIPITDSSISTHHARLTRDGDSFSVEDLGSRNGTYVNGEKITAPRALADNDVIRFGRVLFTFNLASEVRRGDTTERKMLTRRTRQ